MSAPVRCVLLLLAFTCHRLETRNLLNASTRSQQWVGPGPGDCGSRTNQPLTESPNFSMDLRMPGVVPSRSDTYLCMAFPVPTTRDAFIVDFVPQARMDTVHHMLLFGCQTPVSSRSYWDCGSVHGTCEDEASIMYAWARDAPPTKLPKDVGFRVGRNSGMSHFVLQIHYGDVSAFKDQHRDCSGLSLRMTSKPQPFIAGIYLLMSVDTVILPGKRVTNADVSCEYDSYPIYPFAFRTHTHHLGQVVSGYRIRDRRWSLIGRQSPQLPQAFYPVNSELSVKYGDTLAARCVFTGEGRTSRTYIGGTAEDEMCNFYIMYYMDSKHAVPFMSCMETGTAHLFQNIPAEANQPVAVDPSRISSRTHMGHSADPEDNRRPLKIKQQEQLLDQGGQDLSSVMSQLLDSVPVRQSSSGGTENVQLVAQIHSLLEGTDLVPPRDGPVPPTSRDQVLVRDRVHRFHQLHNKPAADPHLEQDSSWPHSSLQLGQVSGLAMDSDSNLVIFHRGDRRWGADSFDSRATFQQRALGPIQQSTILVLRAAAGDIVQVSGRDMFYLPHGITTDADNNYWVTDVALHQVMKVSSDGRDRTLLTLGEAFTPGSDHAHFCQPTDVAVDPQSGNVFVSDGYCNARILKFSADGRYLSEWGAGSSDRRRRVPFRVPHSLAFLADRQEVCVADRENGRIQCFLADTGEFVKEIKNDQFGGEVFAISFSPVRGGLIFAVNGKSAFGQSAPLRGFTIDYSTKEVLDTFSPEEKQFQMPHDVVVSSDGSVFVGDAGSNSVFKFSEKAHRSVKKAGIQVQELEEMETVVQTKIRPKSNTSNSAAVQHRTSQQRTSQQRTSQQSGPPPEEKKTKQKQERGGLVPVVLTVLLLVPLLLLVTIGGMVCWKRNGRHEVKGDASAAGGLLGKIRGSAVGSLNLGNFFASHKGYSRGGFDQLSTEGSDHDRNEPDSSESENEEYSAPPPRHSS